MEPIIDHIQITVKDMSTAVPFYDKLLPLLGFDVQSRVSAVIEEHEFHVVEYSHPRLAFAITSPPTIGLCQAGSPRIGPGKQASLSTGSRSRLHPLYANFRARQSAMP